MEIAYRDERALRLLRRLARHTAIAKRHLVALEYQRGDDSESLYAPAAQQPDGPGMGVRNARFDQAADELIAEALAKLPREDFSTARTLVTATCTHASSPGLERPVFRHSSLPPDVSRWNLGFMGCSAGLAALRLVHDLTPTRQNALIAVCELSSLHFQYSTALDQITANMLFADGAAVIRLSPEPSPVAVIGAHCRTLPAAADQMKWFAGDNGLRLELAQELPDTLGACVADVVDSFLAECGGARSDIAHWLVHPGGPQILDSVATSLRLAPDALDESRAVLRDYGNMSSATVFFILERMMARGLEGKCVALAFGPGLTIELALLEFDPARGR